MSYVVVRKMHFQEFLDMSSYSSFHSENSTKLMTGLGGFKLLNLAISLLRAVSNGS